VRPLLIVLALPDAGERLGFRRSAKLSASRSSSRKRAWKDSAYPFSQGAPRFDVEGPDLGSANSSRVWR